MPPTPNDPVVTVIAIYSWPFLFATVVGLIVWIWKERTFERAVNLVRADFAQAIGTHRKVTDEELDALRGRATALETAVFGKSGLSADMKMVKRGIRVLLLGASDGDKERAASEARDMLAELE